MTTWYTPFSKIDPTVKEFKEIVDYYQNEVYCDGERTASHSYPSKVDIIMVDDDNNIDYGYELVGHDIITHMGCGCWTGMSLVIRKIKKEE